MQLIQFIMEDTVKNRLISFLKYKGIGQKKFALECGLSAGFVNGIRVSIQPKSLSLIESKFPELNTTWLIMGTGKMLKSESVIEPTETYFNNNIDYKERWIEALQKIIELQGVVDEMRTKALDSKKEKTVVMVDAKVAKSS